MEDLISDQYIQYKYRVLWQSQLIVANCIHHLNFSIRASLEKVREGVGGRSAQSNCVPIFDLYDNPVHLILSHQIPTRSH